MRNNCVARLIECFARIFWIRRVVEALATVVQVGMRVENHAMVRIVRDQLVRPRHDTAAGRNVDRDHHELLSVGLELVHRVSHVKVRLAGDFIVVDERRLLAVRRSGTKSVGKIELRTDVVVAPNDRIGEHAVESFHSRAGIVPFARKVVVNDIAVLNDKLNVPSGLIVD